MMGSTVRFCETAPFHRGARTTSIGLAQNAPRRGPKKDRLRFVASTAAVLRTGISLRPASGRPLKDLMPIMLTPWMVRLARAGCLLSLTGLLAACGGGDGGTGSP